MEVVLVARLGPTVHHVEPDQAGELPGRALPPPGVHRDDPASPARQGITWQATRTWKASRDPGLALRPGGTPTLLDKPSVVEHEHPAHGVTEMVKDVVTHGPV